jgi:iron-sulfur cluster repair protein YtfE (RIC family)
MGPIDAQGARMSTDASPSPGISALARRLEVAHRRIERAVEELARLAAARDWAAVAPAARALLADATRHHRIEEETLFPIFESSARRFRRATGVLRHEHTNIEDSLSDMADAAVARDPERFADALARLELVRPEHEMKEEHLLFPHIENALSTAERSQLEARLDDVRRIN